MLGNTEKILKKLRGNSEQILKTWEICQKYFEINSCKFRKNFKSLPGEIKKFEISILKILNKNVRENEENPQNFPKSVGKCFTYDEVLLRKF